MKVFISFDMEGVAGIVDWSQCRGPGQHYEEGRRLLLGEVNAAIDGALAGGATEIVCNDSHGTMFNLDPAALHGQAAYVAGRHKPMYMTQGLDATFDAIFLVGYHGSISGEGSVLSHTYNPSVISHVALNGERVGESGINALVAVGFGVPVALVTGDQHTIAEAEALMPDAEQVTVKASFTRFGAVNLHPGAACAQIFAAARRAVERAGDMKPPRIGLPAALDVHMQTADMAELASWIRDVRRTGTRTVRIEGEDPVALYRAFVGVTYITRVAEGR
jgi:D-amino peptidase